LQKGRKSTRGLRRTARGGCSCGRAHSGWCELEGHVHERCTESKYNPAEASLLPWLAHRAWDDRRMRKPIELKYFLNSPIRRGRVN